MNKNIKLKKRNGEKCPKCNGVGMVQVAPNARGIKTCPYCSGKGYFNESATDRN